MKKLLIGTLVVGLAAVLFVIGCSNPTSSSGDDTYSADIIIVGAGGAGMTAAFHAAEKGASVIILEKASVVGGNTLVTGSGLNALKTGDQADIDAFISSEMEPNSVPKNPAPKRELVEVLVRESLDTINYLRNKVGMTIPDPTGTSRNYKASPNFAQTMIPLLYDAIVNNGVKILCNMEATDLITDNDGEVTGVKATDAKGNELTFNGNAVVLATGGFGQNYAMVNKANDAYKDVFTTAEIAPTTGDGLVMAKAIGAGVVDMDQIQLNQVVELATHANINYGTRMRQIPFIFVNKYAQRFTDERTQGSQVALEAFPRAVMQQDGHYAYFIFDQTTMNHPAAAAKLREFYDRGLLLTGFTYADLAKKLRIDEAAFEATVTEWNTVTCVSHSDTYGRTATWLPLSTAPYYGVKFSIGVQYSMGGLTIDPDTRVLKTTSGEVIPGLYAAGEVTGGVHGSYRVDGTGLSDTLIFGRHAGIAAAAYAVAQGKLPLEVPSDENQGSAVKGNFVDGVYTGIGVGRFGDITVKVTVEGKSITKIEVLPNDETPTMIMAVENDLIPSIIRTQSVKVDVTSGATYSSNGVLDAVADALGISR